VAGFQSLNVPFRGGPDMVKALIGGEVDFTIVATVFAAQFAPKGLVRVLAALDERRLPELPEVPTVREAGVNVPPLRVWGATQCGPARRRLCRSACTARWWLPRATRRWLHGWRRWA
jgi:tripartite-type tricarboxylate transporter receptor subunit TctC